jgi:predicted DsbA family dithiol-disulfide isomerase
MGADRRQGLHADFAHPADRRSGEDRGARILQLRVSALQRLPSADFRLGGQAARRRGVQAGAGHLWPRAWANLAKLYYALEATGDLARVDGEVFKALHNDRLNLFEEKAIVEWVGKKGVDPKKFAEAFNSFGVMSKVKRGDQLAQAYKIQGVPAVAVDGKYLVGGSGFNEVLASTDKLIAKARSEKPGKK